MMLYVQTRPAISSSGHKIFVYGIGFIEKFHPGMLDKKLSRCGQSAIETKTTYAIQSFFVSSITCIFIGKFTGRDRSVAAQIGAI